ncbi:hypothetical protein [Sphingomonas aerolata]|uniref:hypothetical protein n=1 Tax=Sphingomonas aerolata TaxID=185951 RepID=UPI00141A8E58|nr:hypothetical protein [Sphingomonas aerolata]NII58967.1 hypothetical protein [Sphingomonas aerolata]
MADAKPRPTGNDTLEVDRKRLPDGKTNWSASGALPDPVIQEVGIVPLKAINTIVYGAQQTAAPGSLFVPPTAVQRAELLQGQYPAAEEPSTAELSLFSEQQSEFA